ncbi:hypothetical protein KCG44_09410 [Pacificimonas sp. WHA3]|uniref:TolA protein n=1 Tax=Pacificimonas pallii TaxID=2827236 RepID=A0ABS6SF27_9SPHN|nr:hypothetical protein [Pacificimonas pallii]MBV7256999.1 hypothetical protein [Pacificimonas pallii]
MRSPGRIAELLKTRERIARIKLAQAEQKRLAAADIEARLASLNVNYEPRKGISPAWQLAAEARQREGIFAAEKAARMRTCTLAETVSSAREMAAREAARHDAVSRMATAADKMAVKQEDTRMEATFPTVRSRPKS